MVVYGMKKGNYDTNDLLSSDYIDAYVDGSYSDENKIYGAGVALVNNGNLIKRIAFYGEEEEYLLSRNVAGEIQATIAAVQYAVENNYKEITVFYDYKGIEEWATGNWKAKKVISQDYVNYISALSKCIKIKFKKVKAHSGNKFNELADTLAAKGAERKVIDV